jgi:hypothetical protein
VKKTRQNKNYSVFERSGDPVRVKKTRQNKNWRPALIQSEPGSSRQIPDVTDITEKPLKMPLAGCRMPQQSANLHYRNNGL